MTIEHVDGDETNPVFFPDRTVLTDESIRPSTLSFTLGTLISGGQGSRYNTQMVRLWFEFEAGEVPRYKGAQKAQYQRDNARGGYAVGQLIDRSYLRQLVNRPRLPPTARLAETILSWQEGSIKAVHSITVMASR